MGSELRATEPQKSTCKPVVALASAVCVATFAAQRLQGHVSDHRGHGMMRPCAHLKEHSVHIFMAPCNFLCLPAHCLQWRCGSFQFSAWGEGVWGGLFFLAMGQLPFPGQQKSCGFEAFSIRAFLLQALPGPARMLRTRDACDRSGLPSSLRGHGSTSLWV
mmetsp:Transcript_14125/g.38730  ORF Transcript_14125/g.38730 Transcript_14125/m.38730 type:complete len:161 (+) Transcript_14125:1232-1714(+)